MPLYEYRCADCKSHFELLVSHEHADAVVCVKCHSENVRRLLSVFATRRGEHEAAFDDLPSAGSCGCDGGSCGCH
jgi:putative FmdB family regulatory protein